MKTQWMVISALLFALITAIFAVINVDKVQVNFGFVQTQTPLILVILISTLLGGLTVFFFAIIRQFKLQRRIRGLEKQLASQSAAAPESASGMDDVHTDAEYMMEDSARFSRREPDSKENI
ncbi:LapA family protein [Paenibacillus pinihumi]|uniref:LapA family protein n=1 Tax=Paenibacillus pinihumi TaxID=669462 RepID=UPI0004193B14|nr:lipopolysaccharide assembly protein LapA domain-containing protein [Paenibacillus pinihumi]